MSNKSKTLYVGVTSDLVRRVHEHKHKLVPGFTARYNVTKLVYYQATSSIDSAIAREKQIKGWLRKKKIALIESMNPKWKDLSLARDSTKEETLSAAKGDAQVHCHSERSEESRWQPKQGLWASTGDHSEALSRGDSSFATLIQNDSGVQGNTNNNKAGIQG